MDLSIWFVKPRIIAHQVSREIDQIVSSEFLHRKNRSHLDNAGEGDPGIEEIGDVVAAEWPIQQQRCANHTEVLSIRQASSLVPCPVRSDGGNMG